MPTEDPRELSQSFREPQLEPSESVITVLQDHGPGDGGWGPAAVMLPWIGSGARPFIYTGSDPNVIEVMTGICRSMAQETGKPTKLVRYTVREDLVSFGGSS